MELSLLPWPQDWTVGLLSKDKGFLLFSYFVNLGFTENVDFGVWTRAHEHELIIQQLSVQFWIWSTSTILFTISVFPHHLFTQCHIRICVCVYVWIIFLEVALLNIQYIEYSDFFYQKFTRWNDLFSLFHVTISNLSFFFRPCCSRRRWFGHAPLLPLRGHCKHGIENGEHGTGEKLEWLW